MNFNGKFFDGKHSASKSCILACDEKSSLSLLYDGHAIVLQNVSWKQASTNLLITSESFDKYGHIVIANADDQHALLKLLRNIKKTKSIWYSHSFLVYYGIISLLVALWVFMDSLVFLFPTSIEPWLEKQAKAIHFRNAKVIASASTDATLKKIQDAFAAIDPALKGIEITIVKENSINAVTLPNKKKDGFLPYV